MTSDDVARVLQADPDTGLAVEEAACRLALQGPNRLREARARSAWALFFGQFADFMIGVLLVAAAISGMVGELVDTLAIVFIVLLNAVIGFVQERRAERAMAALRQLAAPEAMVRRAGATLAIPAEELVTGDLVLLEAGALVPADLRIIGSASLRMAEAALTGESAPVSKTVAPLEDDSLGIADRTNIAYKGTLVVSGRATGLAVATGMQTELGRIAGLLSSQPAGQTPLQARLARFGRRLALAVLGVCAVILVAGLARGEPPLLMFMTSISLAVAAIPEALPAVVAISLALGAGRMVRWHALVRRLPAVETLGSVTYVCSDKTGTLTLNRMVVEQAWTPSGGQRAVVREPPVTDEAVLGLFRVMVLVNDAVPVAGAPPAGEPTEAALLEAALAAGIDWHVLARNHPRVLEQPFDSELRRMATVHADGEGWIACVKGAPEAVLPLCVAGQGPDGQVFLDREAVAAIAGEMAAQGLRVLAVATRRFERQPVDPGEATESLVLLGLVGLMDPPREEARQAVAECVAAGIVPVMITGDHPATAIAIARRLGILSSEGQAMTGAQLALLSDEALARQVRLVRVYARMDPEQKIRIVAALQSAGECVAMTGDGVNDAPALRRADIGIAMGRDGTDVAREASDMVLLDDNFATIVHAVREGRRIYDNIRKFIRFAMTGNAGEIWTIFLAPFLGLPIPLMPVHILWVNLVTDGLPGLALAGEPAERRVMQRPPRATGENVFSGGMWQHIVWVGLLIGAVSLFAQAWALGHGAHAQSMVFTVLTLAQLAHVLAIRSDRDSLFSIGWLSNPALLATVLLTTALQLATLYVPALNAVFVTVALEASELGVCFGLALVVFVGVEAEKYAVRRGWIYSGAV